MAEAKKLFQEQLGTGTVSLYSTPTDTKTQITEIWIANPTAETISITIKTHGDLEENTILDSVEVEENLNIDGSKIVLDETEEIYAEGEDLVATAYGIEEGV